MSSITGWGRGEWGDGPWGNPDSVVVTGVVGTSGLGSVTVSGAANVTLTGVSATGAIGTEIVGISVSISVTGVSATGEVGSLSIWGLVDTTQTPNWEEIAA
jgi:hypothetical protein